MAQQAWAAAPPAPPQAEPTAACSARGRMGPAAPAAVAGERPAAERPAAAPVALPRPPGCGIVWRVLGRREVRDPGESACLCDVWRVLAARSACDVWGDLAGPVPAAHRVRGLDAVDGGSWGGSSLGPAARRRRARKTRVTGRDKCVSGAKGKKRTCARAHEFSSGAACGDVPSHACGPTGAQSGRAGRRSGSLVDREVGGLVGAASWQARRRREKMSWHTG